LPASRHCHILRHYTFSSDCCCQLALPRHASALQLRFLMPFSALPDDYAFSSRHDAAAAARAFVILIFSPLRRAA